METLYLAGLLLGVLGMVLGNVLLLAIGVAILAYWVCLPDAIVLAETSEPASTAEPTAEPTVGPVDNRQPQVEAPTHGARSFVHIPLYQETFPYEKQAMDMGYAELATRNAVDPTLQHGDKHVEFIQYLNEGKGPCQKDHWMVQAEELPPPTLVVPEPDNGTSTIS